MRKIRDICKQVIIHNIKVKLGVTSCINIVAPRCSAAASSLGAGQVLKLFDI